MKKHIAFLLSFLLLTVSVYATRYSTFEELKRGSPRITHSINSFDGNGCRGGGTFIWVKESSVGLQTITGLQIVVPSISDGYWIREAYSNSRIIYPEYFGANHKFLTLAAQGISQGQANTWWGTNTVNVTVDTYDQAAINYFNNNAVDNDWQIFNVTSHYYVFSSPTSVPTLSTGANKKTFIYFGNGVTAKSIHTTNFSFITDNYTNQTTQENTQTARQFIFEKWNFIGTSTGSGSGDTCINLYSSTNTVLRDINIKNFQNGISYRHCLESIIENVEVNQCKNIGIYIGRGHWPGVYAGSAGSNVCTVNNVRFFSGGTVADLYIKGCSGVGVNHITLEGPSGGNDGMVIEVDALASGTVRDFDARIFHIEKTYNNAAIRIIGDDEIMCNFYGIWCQYDNLVIDATGNAYITVEKVVYNTGGMKYGHRGTATGWPMWNFINCKSVNNPSAVYTVKHAQSWQTGGGLVLPTFAGEIDVNYNAGFPYQKASRGVQNYNVFETKGIYSY